MIRLASPRTVLAGSILVLAANAMLLGSAAWNRLGRPSSALVLTERELTLPLFREEENNEVFLSLRLGQQAPPAVRTAAVMAGREPPPAHRYSWLDRQKLQDLGFGTELRRLDTPEQVEGHGAAPRQVWLALEFEGPAWTAWLAAEEERVQALRAKVEQSGSDKAQLGEAEALLAIDRVQRSRLFAVDAALNRRDLEARYSDRNRYLVVPGLIGAAVFRDARGDLALGGNVMAVFPGEIIVPRNLKPLLAPMLPRETWSEKSARRKAEDPIWPVPQGPRYRATLAYGRRSEPWLAAVEVLPPQ